MKCNNKGLADFCAKIKQGYNVGDAMLNTFASYLLDKGDLAKVDWDATYDKIVGNVRTTPNMGILVANVVYSPYAAQEEITPKARNEEIKKQLRVMREYFSNVENLRAYIQTHLRRPSGKPDARGRDWCHVSDEQVLNLIYSLGKTLPECPEKEALRAHYRHRKEVAERFANKTPQEILATIRSIKAHFTQPESDIDLEGIFEQIEQSKLDCAG